MLIIKNLIIVMANIQLNANLGASSIHYILQPNEVLTNLKNNPSISHFKRVFKKHTNFAIERHPHSFHTVHHNDKFNSEFVTNIHKYGDLLHKLYLEIDIECKLKEGSNPTYTVNHFINSLIKTSKIKIADETIEENTSQWTQIKSELMTKTHYKQVRSSTKGGGNLVDLNFTSDINRTEYDTHDIDQSTLPLIVGGNFNDVDIDATSTIKKRFIYEFDFWFSRNVGQAIPLGKLNNHDLKLIFNTETKTKLIGDDVNIELLNIDRLRLYSEQIHLGKEEKIFFNSGNTIDYVIDKMNYQTFTTPSKDTDTKLNTLQITLPFKHPVKCLVWALQNEGTPKSNKGQGPCYFASITNTSLYGADGTEGDMEIRFNGNKLTQSPLPMIFYTRKFPKEFCNNVPALDRIGIYSFALNPFELDVSGYCHFGRINEKMLYMTLANNDATLIEKKKLYVFVLEYNLLRFEDGYAGLVYHN
jgi:hypothetical protein